MTDRADRCRAHAPAMTLAHTAAQLEQLFG
jgi:hypothetical protein